MYRSMYAVEMQERHKRATMLKNFACFYECATYPNCKRLTSAEEVDKLNDLRMKAEQAVDVLMLKAGLIRQNDDYEMKLKIYCPEYRGESLDLGD